MSIERNVELAKSGNHDAIMALGTYYNSNKEYHKAKEWFVLGAEYGYPDCMHLASILGFIVGHTTWASLGSRAALEAIVILEEAMHWATEAYENGIEKAKAETMDITGEMGICWFLASSNEFSSENISQGKAYLERAITMLKSAYQATSSIDVMLYLAFALHLYGYKIGHTKENDELELRLLNICVNEHFDEIRHADVASYYLGTMYMQGNACAVNYDKAVLYFTKAHNAGFDCSDLLSKFRKKLFGGYTLKA